MHKRLAVVFMAVLLIAVFAPVLSQLNDEITRKSTPGCDAYDQFSAAMHVSDVFNYRQPWLRSPAVPEIPYHLPSKNPSSSETRAPPV